jgi:GNAT superfamily N-acetyltransferase
MRLVQLDDIDFIAGCLLDIHAESTSYSRLEVDKQYAINNLSNGIYAETIKGFIEPGKGFILFTEQASWFSPTKELVELLLYVKPQWRGTSVAVKLVCRMELYARNFGLKTIHVGTSLGIADSKAIKLYEGLGYSISSTGLIKRV